MHVIDLFQDLGPSLNLEGLSLGLEAWTIFCALLRIPDFSLGIGAFLCYRPGTSLGFEFRAQKASLNEGSI